MCFVRYVSLLLATSAISVSEMMTMTKIKLGWKLKDQNKTFENTRTKIKIVP